ncbi:TPA: putrescine-ornithine antiporter, partial [Escherichia coli]|nr:putrescine-ornithine antiporter [Escherichia coli]
TSKNAPITGMIILGVAQTILSLMTISPSLNNQFNSLVNLAVVTNLIPYILSMAALIPMHRLYKISSKTHLMILFTAIVGTVYSFYALYSSGDEAMLMGGLVTFSGWSFYGLFVRDNNTCPKDKIQHV